MGKGDKKTKKGKIFAHAHGKKRKKGAKNPFPKKGKTAS